MRESPAERLFGAGTVLFLVALMVVTLYPLLYVLFASLSNAGDLTQHRGALFAPLGLTFEAYRRVLQNPLILSGYRNTLFIVIVGTGLNAFFSALVYIRDPDLYPLQLVLREILISSNVQNMATDVSSGDVAAIGETIKYATIIVATLPILLVYPYLQRYFVKGVAIGAIKE